MKRRILFGSGLALLSLATLLAGCSSTQSARGDRTSAGQADRPDTYWIEGRPAARVETAGGTAWPGQTGDGFSWSSMAFPTGNPATSALGIEKGVPAEVRLNQSFEYEIVVTNLTSNTLREVGVTEYIGDNLRVTDSEPAGLVGEGDTMTWALGSLAPGESKTIAINASALSEGTIGSCAAVSYNSLLCTTIPVVQPELRLTKSGPSDIVRCDPIEYTFVVSNEGTGSVEDVVITDRLPEGLAKADGGRTISIDVGTLAPGESREFQSQVRASRRGEFTNAATARGAGGISADSNEVVTMVREPELEIVKAASRDDQYLGRNVTYDIEVTNVGDGVARDTIIVDELAQGARFVSATEGGRMVENKVTWNVGALRPNDTRTVSVTLTRDTDGMLVNTASASAYCAKTVDATARTQFTGIPAILLEVVDLEDPIEVGNTVTYVITATNQGTKADRNVRIACALAEGQTFVSATGATEGRARNGDVIFRPVDMLGPKEQAVWRVVVRNDQAGDIRFAVSMSSDFLGERPVRETESTNIYE